MEAVVTSTPSSSTQRERERITVRSPASGKVIGEVPVFGAEEVRAAVERARKAQASWGALPVAERARRLLSYVHALIDRQEELCDLISREAGKPAFEAYLHEVSASAICGQYFAKHAEKLLAPRAVEMTLAKHRRATLYYSPRGVVGLITPWNFPLFMPLRDLFMAVVAGNAVVLKPSEVTPLIALKAKQVWDDAGLPPELFQVVTGYGATGAALIDGGIDFCVFTGGVATGRRVAAMCGERLIPCVMELGGKAPLIACSDADVELAAHAAVSGGFANSGQICIAVERVYAHKSIAETLERRIIERTRALRVGDPQLQTVDVGAIIFPKQMDVAEAHIADALAKGAVLATGGHRIEGKGNFFQPTVLTNCNPSMTVMTEEIFGPVVPIMRVDSDEEALSLANRSHLGLNAYVFSKDRSYGEAFAARVEAGSVLVNDVLTNGGMPETPFGGIKQSGFGRVLGEDALREMCNVRHVNVDRIGLGNNNPMWFPYTDVGLSRLRKAFGLLLGGGGLLSRVSKSIRP
jgi:acyl-CoA reductase-like NAD-dependent aldehyde dehydrogenase